ncbi:MAG: efflux RND transporter permease subunit [Ignavibacteriales bacterium]|nr:efflux RND transporter permease subunit [Ignavibacteriales bacterium]
MVRIKDVGRAELGSQDYNSFGRLNGKPAGAMAVYLLPGANQLKAAEAIYATMERAKALLPARHGLQDRLRHHAGGRGLDRRDRADVRRGADPGDAGGLHLPAEHPRDDHPAAHDPGVADRHLHLLPDARVLDQHAVDVRPGAGHRHRGGRRHRRGRGGHPPPRARDEPAGGDRQGHGGGLGAGHRHRPHPLRGVRPGGPARRAGRQHVPAVRADHRHLGAALGVQRAVADARAVRDAAQGADAPCAGRWASSSAVSTRCSTSRTTGYVSVSRLLVRRGILTIGIVAVVAVEAGLLRERRFLPEVLESCVPVTRLTLGNT